MLFQNFILNLFFRSKTPIHLWLKQFLQCDQLAPIHSKIPLSTYSCLSAHLNVFDRIPPETHQKTETDVKNLYSPVNREQLSLLQLKIKINKRKRTVKKRGEKKFLLLIFMTFYYLSIKTFDFLQGSHFLCAKLI